MKKIFCSILLFLASGTIIFAQTGTGKLYDNIPDHPRLLLLKGEEAGIRQTISSDEVWKNVEWFILGRCDEILSIPPVERVLIGRRLLDKSREALRRIFYLSYTWRMTSNSDYLRRAEKEMTAVSDFTDWNPSHFLDVAEMTMALSIGYDWLYYELSPETRSKIKKAIIEKGLKPSLLSENSGWAEDSNNWNQVCNAGMTFGALAVIEDDRELAKKIIDRAIISIKLPMEDYEPDGAYPEGYSYWGYGTSFNVMFLSAMEKVFGKEYGLTINPGFYKTASYLENMTGPTGNSFNYSDAGSGGGLNPAMFWFAGRLNNPALLWSEKFFMENRNPPNDRLLPAIMIWGSGITMNKITPPVKTLWAGQGKNPVVLMRTSWTDPDAIFVGFKCGSPSVNHGHMDAGSFVMESDGVRWAMDFGMQDYNSLETAGVDLWNMKQNSQRWEVYRYNNFVHNTLTVNDQLQFVTGYSSITGFSDKPEMMNAVTNLTSLYSKDLKKAVRGIAIVDKEYVMVRDEIETAGKPAGVKWNMLTSADVVSTGSNEAIFTKEGRKLYLRVVSPASAVLKSGPADPPHIYDAANQGVSLIGFEIEVPAGSKTELVMLLLPEGSVENKAVSGLKLEEWPVGHQ